jgi:ABC-type phosphate transport system auxiliary subunit
VVLVVVGGVVLLLVVLVVVRRTEDKFFRIGNVTLWQINAVSSPAKAVIGEIIPSEIPPLKYGQNGNARETPLPHKFVFCSRNLY